MSGKNVIVAFGGSSPEHEVSVLSAMQAIAALEHSPYSILPLYVAKSGRWLTGEYLLHLEHYQDLTETEKRGHPCTFSHNELGKPVLLETQKKHFFSSLQSYPIHALIPAFHGSEGENGAFQGACEMFNIPYAGSGVLASGIGMDKVKAKELCRAHGIPVVDHVDFLEPDWEKDRDSILSEAQKLEFPLIVKPVNLGSSIGVMRAEDKDGLVTCIESVFRYDANLMVEKAVTPLMEINCSVMGLMDDVRPSVCERPLGQEETLSFEDKYMGDEGGNKGMASADRIIPADISEDLARQIQEISVRVFRLFRASGVARLDFLVNADTNRFYFNEINTIPGSFSFYLWEKSGISIEELMLRLIDMAVKRHQLKQGRVRSYETNLLDQKAVRGIKGLKNKS